MNNTFFQKNKRVIGIVAAIIAFAAITLVYFSPILEGKRLKQHDIEMHTGMSKEIVDYRESSGEQTLWTNSMFGGMPAWNISVRNDSNLMQSVHKIVSMGFPHPFMAVFISFLGFFLLLIVLDCSIWISFIGAIAYGLSSYMFIIIGAGHNSKAIAIAYMAPVIAGIILTYKRKYLWGSILTSFALALEVMAGHIQITYYLAIIVVILVISELISDLIKKKLGHFIKASFCLLVAAVIGVMTSFMPLYANYEFGKETTRGKPILTHNEANQTSGLDRDYITQWSYGKGETWSLLIPNAKGGASAYIGNQNPALEKVTDNRFRQNIAQSGAYWGDQPGTSGPVYVGAIVVFLFVMGALTVKGQLKWALLVATLLSILLSWGKNFMGFTDFFLDFVPGYNKFRAVSMTLVIAEVTMPLLGFLGLAEIMKNPSSFMQNKKKFYIALGITGGFCLLFYIAPKLFFSFLSQSEAEQFAQLTSGKDGSVYQAFATQLENVRVAIFRKDALRSLVFILLSAVPIFLYSKVKLKTLPAFAFLAALILLDMFPIDKRYLNNNNFTSKAKLEKPFTASPADQFIISDNSLDFRVINLTKDVFNDASTSYFHKSVGGYHGAKLRRYQDVITQYLGPEIRQFNTIFKNLNDGADFTQQMDQQKLLNMLNTKYIIYDPNTQPLQNPCALGNAWIVNDIRWVDTPNEEIDAIGTTDVRHTAILNKEFEHLVKNYQVQDNIHAQINLTEYRPNRLTYSFSGSSSDSTNASYLIVFSEIWSDMGWKMYVDGQEHPILRANYLLRCALIPNGEHEIVMEYAPRIWIVGNRIQLISSLVMLLCLVAAIVNTVRMKKQKS